MADMTPLLDFAPPGPQWALNTGSKSGSDSAITYEECPWGRAARFDVVVKEGWEAFKTRITQEAVPEGNVTLVFRVKGSEVMGAVKVKVGARDGTWWEVDALAGADWTQVAVAETDFTLIHDPRHLRGGTKLKLAEAKEIQFEGVGATSDRYTFQIAEVCTTDQPPEGLPGALVFSTDLYRPVGMWSWDYWFAQRGDETYAFYLQAATCIQTTRHGNQHVGHAVSRDLVHWTDLGPALVPENDTWNDRSIATGSTVAFDGKWWMVFTGSGNEVSGLGLAESEDLVHWRKVGDGPVVPLGKTFEAPWKGEAIRWVALADPYVYPEPVDGWFYMVINAWNIDAPMHSRGCLVTMRSRDLKTWAPHQVLAWPGWFTRMETPQLWRHGNLWYLYFGGVREKEMPEEFVRQTPPLATMGNYYFVSEDLEGPYEPGPEWKLKLPDPRFAYICKVLPGPDGGDVLLATLNGDSLSRPFPVEYAEDGSLRVGFPRPQ